jgi:hypothetical protein
VSAIRNCGLWNGRARLSFSSYTNSENALRSKRMDSQHVNGFHDRSAQSGLYPARPFVGPEWRRLKKDWRFVILAFAITFSTTSCGSPGAPVAPSLKLPTPVEDLSAARTGNSVRLTWTMPTRTTDRILLKHSIPAEICRAVADGSCSAISTITGNPGKPANYTDKLPMDLTEGSPRLLTYRVDLRNHAHKSAGPSNTAYTAAGAPPATLIGLTLQLRRDGVLLSWHPATDLDSPIVFHIERVLESKAAPGPAARSPLAPAPPPAMQLLAVEERDGKDPGNAFDADAQLQQRYRYRVERVAALTLSGHAVEVHGEPSDSVEISTADVFPPNVPTGLVAVADVDAGAVDLSWSPQADRDLAGYYVYRRDLGGPLPAQRISAAVIASPAFRDTGAVRGHAYAYSISAIDESGNESARTPEVRETLPNP